MLAFRGIASRVSPRALLQGRSMTTSFVRNINDDPSSLQGPPRAERCINQVSLLGRVGNDPMIRGSDRYPVVMFTLATHHIQRHTHEAIMAQKTDWHRISVFKPSLRGVCEDYLRKGARVFLHGRLSYGEIQDSNGQTHQVTSIIADDLIFLSSPRKGRGRDDGVEYEEASETQR